MPASATVASAAPTSLGMRPLPITSQQWRRAIFLYHPIGETPKNDGNATFPILLLFQQCINTMLPKYIHIPSKGKHAVVRLREVDPDLLSVLLRSGTEECE
eukprot:CAMPEP_0196251986 /NCGR_PEP_ID=MMETSP0913-20130531/48642_1 /TAXON_ID=49265 /ORGANISM="Thalassiosira rotula, Strain GSO102" /LENGTH=100 /DNA_ID=CAMNT_0041538431 /DNA_START=348 /DNA_END=647 /DNA_ORIENTATION=-